MVKVPSTAPKSEMVPLWTGTEYAPPMHGPVGLTGAAPQIWKSNYRDGLSLGAGLGRWEQGASLSQGTESSCRMDGQQATQ